MKTNTYTSLESRLVYFNENADSFDAIAGSTDTGKEKTNVLNESTQQREQLDKPLIGSMRIDQIPGSDSMQAYDYPQTTVKALRSKAVEFTQNMESADINILESAIKRSRTPEQLANTLANNPNINLQGFTAQNILAYIKTPIANGNTITNEQIGASAVTAEVDAGTAGVMAGEILGTMNPYAGTVFGLLSLAGGGEDIKKGPHMDAVLNLSEFLRTGDNSFKSYQDTYKEAFQEHFDTNNGDMAEKQYLVDGFTRMFGRNANEASKALFDPFENIVSWFGGGKKAEIDQGLIAAYQAPDINSKVNAIGNVKNSIQNAIIDKYNTAIKPVFEDANTGKQLPDLPYGDDGIQQLQKIIQSETYIPGIKISTLEGFLGKLNQLSDLFKIPDSFVNPIQNGTRSETIFEGTATTREELNIAKSEIKNFLGNRENLNYTQAPLREVLPPKGAGRGFHGNIQEAMKDAGMEGQSTTGNLSKVWENLQKQYPQGADGTTSAAEYIDESVGQGLGFHLNAQEWQQAWSQVEEIPASQVGEVANKSRFSTDQEKTNFLKDQNDKVLKLNTVNITIPMGDGITAYAPVTVYLRESCVNPLIVPGPFKVIKEIPGQPPIVQEVPVYQPAQLSGETGFTYSQFNLLNFALSFVDINKPKNPGPGPGPDQTKTPAPNADLAVGTPNAPNAMGPTAPQGLVNVSPSMGITPEAPLGLTTPIGGEIPPVMGLNQSFPTEVPPVQFPNNTIPNAPTNLVAPPQFAQVPPPVIAPPNFGVQAPPAVNVAGNVSVGEIPLYGGVQAPPVTMAPTSPSIELPPARFS